MATACVQAICIDSAASISFLGSAASMKASTALTLVSEMPPDGIREAFCIWTSVAFTKSLEVVPSAALRRSHHRLCSPSGGYGFEKSLLMRRSLTRVLRADSLWTVEHGAT